MDRQSSQSANWQPVLGLTCRRFRYTIPTLGKVTLSILRVLRLRIDLGIIDSLYVDKGAGEAAVGQATQG